VSKHLFVDVETLGTESNAVLLSLGMVYADFSEDFTYDQLIETGFYVKFDANEQKEMGRTMEKGTIEWWKKQDKEVFDSEVRVKPTDVKLLDGLNQAAEWIASVPGYSRKTGTVWTRGSIDDMVLGSVCKQAGRAPLFPFYLVRDVRTAVDILYGSHNGYVDIDAPMPNIQKHNPTVDAALDAMMLRYGVPVVG